MPDYIYLLENRLSADQRHALQQLREAARGAETILFLTGDAVRDLTSGHAVRDLEVAIHGNALKLKKAIEKLGGKVWGEDEASRSLYLCFPGTVRVDLVSTHRIEYPKPGKPVYFPASIQEDLRRRDFTANAMAISLNEGSFGLLMDPLNGAADIEARTLRLVSNYGFLEEPALLIRATRYRARLGWDMDPRTLTRYDNAKSEGGMEALSAHARSQELEQIGHEEEGLRVLGALQEEGWMTALYPAWTVAKADEAKLKALHELANELLMQGVHADTSAAQMQLLTADMAAKDLAALKKLMLRPGFVEEWNSLDSLASGFAKVLLTKQNAVPSAGFKLFTSYDPEAVLWLGFTSKSAQVAERYNQFLKVWPEAKQRIPYVLMQEMRITPELPGYNDLLQAIFLQLIDGKLTTPEEMRAYLEPHSPPAPPPQVSIKKTRARRNAEARAKEIDEDEDSDEPRSGGDDDMEDSSGDDDELGAGLGKGDLDDESDEEEEEDDEEADAPPASGKKGAAKAAEAKAAELKGGKKGQKSVAPSAGKAPASPVAENLAKGQKASPSAAASKLAAPAKPVAPAHPAQGGAKLPGKTKPPTQAGSGAKSSAAPAHASAQAAASKKALATSAKPQKAVARTPAKPAAKAMVKKPAPARSAPGKTAAKAKPAAAKTKAVKPSKPSPKKTAKKR
jgi:tRNA nucleotidyltransferase/poly(A) polymerase